MFVRPFPDEGGKHQISNGGGIYPRWRHDGHELFYVTLDDRLVAVPIQITNGRTLNMGPPSVLFTTKMALGANVGIGGFLSHANYAVAEDGRFPVNTTLDNGAASPITIVQNWVAALMK